MLELELFTIDESMFYSFTKTLLTELGFNIESERKESENIFNFVATKDDYRYYIAARLPQMGLNRHVLSAASQVIDDAVKSNADKIMVFSYKPAVGGTLRALPVISGLLKSLLGYELTLEYAFPVVAGSKVRLISCSGLYSRDRCYFFWADRSRIPFPSETYKLEGIKLLFYITEHLSLQHRKPIMDFLRLIGVPRIYEVYIELEKTAKELGCLDEKNDKLDCFELNRPR